MSGRPYLSLFHARSSAHQILADAGGGISLGFEDAEALARSDSGPSRRVCAVWPPSRQAWARPTPPPMPHTRPTPSRGGSRRSSTGRRALTLRLAIAQPRTRSSTTRRCAASWQGAIDLHVFFAHRATPQQQADAGFGTAFEWDVDLTAGYEHSFLRNVPARPGTDHFGGCDTPEIGAAPEGRRVRRVDGARLGPEELRAGDLGGETAGHSGPGPRRQPVGDTALGAEAGGQGPALPGPAARLRCGAVRRRRSRAYYRHYRYPDERLFFSPHCVDNRLVRRAGDGRGAQAATRSSSASAGREGGAVRRQARAVQAAAWTSSRPAPGFPRRACRCAWSSPAQASWPSRSRRRPRAGREASPARFQNQTQMPAVYAAADVLMLPSTAARPGAGVQRGPGLRQADRRLGPGRLRRGPGGTAAPARCLRWATSSARRRRCSSC